MIQMIKRLLRRKRVAAALSRQARSAWRSGDLPATEYLRIREAAKDPKFVDRFMRRLEQDDELLGGVRWDNFVVWLKENWPTILKLLLSLLVMLETDE